MADEWGEHRGSTTREGFAVLGVAIKREPAIFILSTLGSFLFGAMTVADAWVLGWATDNVLVPAFRTGEIKYLIATDVMSRGIDVEGLSHVINYDLPIDIENYVHRIGRTGRIGRDGIAIAFATPEQGGLLTDIEVMINRLIVKDHIPGDWYVPRKVETVPAGPPPKPPEVKRDEQGWGVEEDVGSLDKLGTAPGEVVADDAPAATTPAAPPSKQPVFGRPKRRYSERL